LHIDHASHCPSSQMQIRSLSKQAVHVTFTYILMSNSHLQHAKHAMFCGVNLHGQLFLCALGVVGDAAEPAAAKPKRWGKSRPFYGQVMAVEGLCNLASGDGKDTIRVEVNLGESGLQYTPGDALGVYPLNCNQVCSSPCINILSISFVSDGL